MRQSTLPDALQRTPDLDRWLHIEDDGTITIFTGKVEIGQGIRTTVAQIAAEELDVAPERIRVVLADTARTPDEGYTAGSNSTQGSGGALRQVAAEVRALLLDMAAAQLGAPAHRLRIDDGLIIDPVSEEQISYWALHGGKLFHRQATGNVAPKPADVYTLVGNSMQRIDIPAKVRGQHAFVADMELPGMVYGRVVRPPTNTATLVDVETRGAAQLPGVLAVVRDGSFLGVVAQREEQAVAAANYLRTASTWQAEATLPDDSTIFDRLRQGATESFLVVDGAPTADPIPPVTPPANATQTLEATYYRPFTMHGALGPSAALAEVVGDQLTVWTHSQGVYPLRGALAQVLGKDEATIRLIHVEGPGCYGHNGADDVVLDAALLAGAVPNRPVLVQWSREDEHRWEPFGPAMRMSLSASLDAEGNVVDWNHDVWSYTHSGRPRPREDGSTLLAAQHLARPLPAPPARPGKGTHTGSHRNADPLYNFGSRRIVKHFVPDSPLRTSSLRSLGAFANIFAIESFMDELAEAAGIDPVSFRLRHLADPRGRAVIEAVVQAANWPRRHNTGHGQGIAFAQYKNEKAYAAVVADVNVDLGEGTIHVEQLTIAADAGLIINPDGLRNQLEGGAVQAASWALKEAVRFDSSGFISFDWEHYPSLHMTESPRIQIELINRPDRPPLGAGEATTGPTPAAIANAVYAAVGIRLRHLPLRIGGR